MAEETKKTKTRAKQELKLQLQADVQADIMQDADDGIGTTNAFTAFVDEADLKSTELNDARKEVIALAEADPARYKGRKARIIAVKDEFPIKEETKFSLG